MSANDSALHGHIGIYNLSTIFFEVSPVHDGHTAVGFTTTGVVVPYSPSWFSASFTMEFWCILGGGGAITWNIGSNGPQVSIAAASIIASIPNDAGGSWTTLTVANQDGENAISYVVARYDDATQTLSIWLDGVMVDSVVGVTGNRHADDGVSTPVLSGAGGSIVAHQAYYTFPLSDARIITHATIGSNGVFNPSGGTTGGGGSGGGGGSPPVFTASSPPAGIVGTAYSYQYQSSGTAPLTFARASGSIPTGLTLGSDGLLSGTPTTAGTFTYTVSVTNVDGSASTQEVTTITGGTVTGTAPVITSFLVPDGVQGNSYFYQFTASGSTPLTWNISAGSLPTGVTINSATGVLSGTASAAGTFTFTIHVSNVAGSDSIAGIDIIIAPSGGGGGAGTRDARVWPFAANSVWNTPIGSGATYDPAISAGYFSGMNDGGNYTNGFGRSVWDSGYVGEANLTQSSVNPFHEGHYVVIGQAPGHIGDNHWAADYYLRDDPSNSNFTVISVDLTGPGINTQTMPWSGGSGAWGHVNVFGSSNIAGLVRKYDIDQGIIRHVLCCTLDATNLKFGQVYPASAQDGDAATSYSGLAPIGSLLAIPATTVKPGGLSPIGSIVWDAMQNYGVYVTDRGAGAPHLEAEANMINYPGWLTFTGGELGSTLGPQLRRVNNNSSANIGGPGTRRAPLAPASFI